MNTALRMLVAVSLATVATPCVAAKDYPQDAQAWLGLVNQAESDRLEGVTNIVEKIEGGMTDLLTPTLGPGQQDRCLNCRVSLVETVRVPGNTVTVPGGTAFIPDGSLNIPDGGKNIPDGADNIPDGADNIPDGADNIPNAHEMSLRHQLSPGEVAAYIGESPTTAMKGMAKGMGDMQDALADNQAEILGDWAGVAGMLFGDVKKNQGVRADIDNRTWEDDERQTPWLNPFRMFGAGSYMYSEAAKGSAEAHQSLANRQVEAQQAFDRIRQGIANAVLAGMELVDGQQAMRIDMPVPPEGQAGAPGTGFAAAGPGDTNFVPQSSSVWIRPGSWVMVKHRVDGIATEKGQSRDFFIENIRSDFRNVPNSDMYEPYRRTMRMGGTLDAKQQKEMEEARKQLAEFDKQLASMPADQRQMVENMMGSQMDAVRSMANGGAFEYVEVIDEIVVNADLKAMFGSGQAVLPSADDLLHRIQVGLTALGYTPGNTDGVMDTMTTVAISQYQAERGLAVTGEPSEALATRIAADVAN